MREEPVIYINGRPFVLREDERPFKNLQEYTGIDVRRLEQMELRLKNDILQVCHHLVAFCCILLCSLCACQEITCHAGVHSFHCNAHSSRLDYCRSG